MSTIKISMVRFSETNDGDQSFQSVAVALVAEQYNFSTVAKAMKTWPKSNTYYVSVDLKLH